MSDSSPAILGEPTEEGVFVVGVVVVVLAAVPGELPVPGLVFGVLVGAGV